jgi:hypothetical protein
MDKVRKYVGQVGNLPRVGNPLGRSRLAAGAQDGILPHTKTN